MADIIFGFYIILMIIVCCLSYTKWGKALVWEYLAFRDTKRFYKRRGIRWP